jgi:AcrR family transcriptional regulator
MKTKRTYTMSTRAAAAEETRARVLRAAFDLQTERLSSEINLDDVAERAGVSVQTVLRHFGSRAGLFQAAITFGADEVREERRTPVGDVAAAVRVIVDHYEKRGDMALMMLAQETTHEHVRHMAAGGKDLHRRWVLDVFAPQLEDLATDLREETTDLLVVATDVYTWKLLRRDRGHSRGRTEQRMHTLVTAVLSAAALRKDT